MGKSMKPGGGGRFAKLKGELERKGDVRMEQQFSKRGKARAEKGKGE